ncbi:hypothetical protein [Merismopedia glauca]|uniref:Uncharacterized protein n=1 Tax=Merismopedia glauca CCAP 1448/3 TaxID=1296344 RepID=A0A2T1C844_9CYAN|nr:hypothetical protein [Merismopedia glauca]PSB04455.1 hypothetical protein C7B64_03970 [Merismopedia glauca CCAP 1448/3]
MNNEPRIPDLETRVRHLTKLRQLSECMDRHLADLDELNARLQAENQKSPLAIYHKKRQQRLAELAKE